MTVRVRIWIEAVGASVCGVLAVVTIFWRDWIEVSGWDPDRHDGSLEWAIVVILAITALTVGGIARRQHRQLAFEIDQALRVPPVP